MVDIDFGLYLYDWRNKNLSLLIVLELAEVVMGAVFGCLKDESLLQINMSYCEVFQCSKCLSLGQECVVKEVKDISKIVEDDVDGGCSGAVVVKAEVIAVTGMDSYRNCNAKFSIIYKFYGQYNKCNAKVKLLKCREKNVAGVVLKMLMEKSTS